VHYAEPEERYPIAMARVRGSIGEPVLASIAHYNTYPIGDRPSGVLILSEEW